jgi:predicted nucleic acid-binding protein
MNKVIISDTSCLIALTNINALFILHELFDEIFISNEVFNEYGQYLPEWIKIVSVKNIQSQLEIEQKLDKGEASSIALALENPNSLLIIDELKGRSVAQLLNIEIIGTIGLLILAKKKGIITDLYETVQK